MHLHCFIMPSYTLCNLHALLMHHIYITHASHIHYLYITYTLISAVMPNSSLWASNTG